MKVLLYKGQLTRSGYLFENIRDLVDIGRFSDDAVIKSGYEHLGSILPSCLDGEFSFALYDEQKDLYFASRDPLGIKALYYTKTSEGYHFSSGISELLELPDVEKKPNLRSMESILYSNAVEYTDTMYEGIYRVPPGCYLKIKDGQENLVRYWHPETIKVDYSITEEEAAQKIKELLEKAIQKRTDDVDRTAFELSGGLDSSSILSLFAQNETPSKIFSYSMGFEGLKCDESMYLQSMLETYALDYQTVDVSHLDYTGKYSLENLYKISPNWPITLTFAMTLPMLEKMKQDGKEFVMTGQGGDHLFTGSQYVYYDLFRRGRFLSLFDELKNEVKPWAKIKKFIIKPSLGKKLTNIVMKLLGKKQNDPFGQEETSIIDLSTEAGIRNPAFKNELDMVTSAAQSMIMDGNLFHAAESYFGIEFRHPFFDRELVEYTLSLPPSFKYKKRTIKWILREAMHGILPEMIKNRRCKAEFSEPILQQIDALDLDTLLKDPYIVKLGLIEQSLVDKHRQAYEDKTFKYITFLWTIINVEYWYRYNFETV